MKVLFISRHIPYRADSGITIKMLNLLTCLRSVCDVACAYLVDEKEGDERVLEACRIDVANYLIKAENRSSALKRYLGHLLELFTMSAALRKALSEIMKKEQPDVVWLEFGYLCHFIPFFRKFAVPVVCGSHNSQFKLDFEIWKSNANLVYRLKMAPFVLLYFIHEKLFFRLSDLFLCISRQDSAYYSSIIPAAKLRILPFLFDGRNSELAAPFVPGHPYLCMVGSLRSYQNYSATLFALDEVWPILERENSNLRLYIIGELPRENSLEFHRLSERMARTERVVLTGRVDSVIPYVKGALVSLVPLSLGSGVRTKIIESAACMTPVVSTSIGAEGLPFVDGESIYLADSAIALANKTLDLISDARTRNRIAEKAYEKYREELSYEAGVRMLRNIFHDLNLMDV